MDFKSITQIDTSELVVEGPLLAYALAKEKEINSNGDSMGNFGRVPLPQELQDCKNSGPQTIHDLDSTVKMNSYSIEENIDAKFSLLSVFKARGGKNKKSFVFEVIVLGTGDCNGQTQYFGVGGRMTIIAEKIHADASIIDLEKVSVGVEYGWVSAKYTIETIGLYGVGVMDLFQSKGENWNKTVMENFKNKISEKIILAYRNEGDVEAKPQPMYLYTLYVEKEGKKK